MNAGRPARLWPGRPRPLPGETFSSWLTRTAAANGLTPAELYDVATYGAHLYSRDLDRLAERSLLIRLSAVTDIPLEILADTTVTRWAGRLYDPDESHIRLPWLPSVGTERTRPSFGQQFCPLCLAEASEPHFLLRWRLHFVTACHHHRVVLADRCHECGEPIQPLKVVRARGGDLECHKCGSGLLAAPVVATDDLLAQTRLLAAASQTEVELAAATVIRPPIFFQLALRLFRLVASGSFATPLRTHLAADSLERRQIDEIPLTADLYRFTSMQRHLLIRLVVRMLEDWPVRFEAACAAAGISHWQLERTSRSPFTLLAGENLHAIHHPSVAIISPN